MLSRRALIRNGFAASAVSGLPVLAAVAAPTQPSVWIVDTDLRGALEFSVVYGTGPLSMHPFASDPGRLWMQVIEPQLRERPMPIAGFTSAPTLFCLQFLARDYGLVLAGHVKGVAVPTADHNQQQALVDLRDPHYRDRSAGYSWRLLPTRG